MITFANPFADIKDGDADWLRINQDVSKTAIRQIRVVNMDPGFVTTAISMFIKCLANECKRNNWTITDGDKLIEFIRKRCS